MAKAGTLMSWVGWSATWAVGAAIGVALGAYLTVQGSAAAPGVSALDMTELVVLPLVTGVAVFVVSFIARLIASGVRRLGAPSDADQ